MSELYLRGNVGAAAVPPPKTKKKKKKRKHGTGAAGAEGSGEGVAGPAYPHRPGFSHAGSGTTAPEIQLDPEVDR